MCRQLPTKTILVCSQNIRYCAPMKVLVLQDGKPGHENQSHGIVDALRLLGKIELRYVHLPKRTKVNRIAHKYIYKHIMQYLISKRQLKRAVRIVKIEHLLNQPPPDIIVSTGNRTIFTNTLLAQHFNCQNIYVGRCKKCPADNFSVAIHEYTTLENTTLENTPSCKNTPPYIACSKPTPMVEIALEKPKTPPQKLALLIGGPTRNCPLRKRHINKLACFLQQSPLQWIIFTSLRTPKSWGKIFAQVACDNPRFQFYDYNKTGSIKIANHIGKCDGVVLTADSMSMISEAVAVQRPTVGITTPSWRENQSDKKWQQALQNNNRLALIKPDDINTQSLYNALASCQPLTENTTTILARKLAQRLDLRAMEKHETGT